MKTGNIVVGMLLVTLFGGIIYHSLPDNTTSYEAPVVKEEVIEVVDPLDQAKAELERLNAQIDEEEERLLKLQAELLAQYESENQAIEERLEAIVETRLSFTSAPARNE